MVVEYLILGLGFIALVETMILVMARNDVLFSIYMALMKKKGVKTAIMFFPDMTFTRIAVRPDEEGKITMGEDEYFIEKKNMLFDKDHGVQGMVLHKGEQYNVNPFASEKKMDSNLFKNMVKKAKMLGMLEAQGSDDMLKKLVLVAAGAAVIGAGLSFMNMLLSVQLYSLQM